MTRSRSTEAVAIEAISARRRTWIEVVESGDVDGYVALLTPDAEWIPPSGEALVGRESFRRWVAPFLERFAYDFELSVDDVRVAGERALERGAFVSRMTPREGGEAASHGGRYVVLWRRDADGWRIDRYVDVTPD